MLNVFTLTNGRLFQEEIESLAGLADVKPVWVDLESPTSDEKAWVSARFGVNIPSDAVDDDLEESARFYEEDNGELHIRSDFLIDAGDASKGPGAETARNVRVAFILVRNMLFTIHDEDLPVFRLLRLRARRTPALIEDAKDVLLKLYDADAEYSADALEGIYDMLEKVSARVLKDEVNDSVAAEALAAIAREEDLNGRIRRNMMDTRRAVRGGAADPARHRLAGLAHRLPVRQDQLPDGHHRRLHQHQPEQGDQDLLGGGRGDAAADADREHLRHELQDHAGAGLGRRLPFCARPDGGLGGGAVHLFPAQGLAALGGAARGFVPGKSGPRGLRPRPAIV
jgi:Mg2+ and Co2+ transporter CorA